MLRKQPKEGKQKLRRMMIEKSGERLKGARRISFILQRGTKGSS